MFEVRRMIAGAALVLAACSSPPRSKDASLAAADHSAIGREPAGATDEPTIVDVPGGAHRIHVYPPASGEDWKIARYADTDAGPYLVTFADGVTAEARAAILALGTADRFPMLDAHSAVVRLTAAQRATVEAAAGVATVAMLPPAARVSDQLMTAAQATAGNARGAAARVQIDFFDDVDAATGDVLGEVLARVGAREVQVAPGGARALVPLSALDEVARISDVRWIEPLEAAP
jgi:hypothetical protein